MGIQRGNDVGQRSSSGLQVTQGCAHGGQCLVGQVVRAVLPDPGQDVSQRSATADVARTNPPARRSGGTAPPTSRLSTTVATATS